MAKLDKQQKRLQVLKRQLYGKELSFTNLKAPSEMQKTTSSDTFAKIAAVTANSTVKLEDITYLKKDLTKIFALSSSAISIQILLYFLTKNHLINLKFF